MKVVFTSLAGILNQVENVNDVEEASVKYQKLTLNQSYVIF